MMKITYDPEADAMYIYLKQDYADRTVPIDDNTNLDFDKEGNLLGIEILFVKERKPELLKILQDKITLLA